MDLLIDTHIFVWFVSGDSRLSSALRYSIIDPDNSVFLSVASVWEIIIKKSLGRIPLPESPEIYIPRQRELHLIESLPITESSLTSLTNLPHFHRDPFDRCLVSQALSNNLTLVTTDESIIKNNVPVLK
jgi:PIN domain nuclease of toxin-antitoxin system